MIRASKTIVDASLKVKKLTPIGQVLRKEISSPHTFPSSFAQQRLWFLDRLETDNPFYNIPGAIHLTGILHITALEQTLDEIVRRHEVLRTTFSVVDGDPVQIIAPPPNSNLLLVDLQELSETKREIQMQQLAKQESQNSFDLARGPLVRTTLLRLSKTDHIFLITMHHIVSDGWSLGVLIRELAELYKTFFAGESSTLPELPIQYVDFAHWQRQWLQGEVLETQLSYWKRQLAGAPQVLELRTDRSRPAVQTFKGVTYSFILPEFLSSALKTLSQQEDVTLFMTLLAAFKVLLYRYTGEGDIVVGTPIANRNRSEIEGLIGFFVNTLALRTDLSGNPTFRKLLAQVRKIALGAYAHQDLPFEKLVEEIQPERDMSRSPLFQVMFALQNFPAQLFKFPGLTSSPFEAGSRTSKYDLTLYMWEASNKLIGMFEYNTDLFNGSTIERMLRHFQTLLEAIVVDPNRQLSDLPLLTDGERHQLLVEWNDTRADYPKDKCIHQLFEEQVEKTPDAVSLIFEDQHLTYQQLHERSNQLAHYLRSLGVGPEILVGICIKRSIEMIVGLLGILKAGGAYVPLDPTYPKERLAFMLDDSMVTVLLTQERLLEELPEHKARVVCLDRDWQMIVREDIENPFSSVLAENLAYVIYTSGSTGKPKGVLGLHRNVTNRIHWEMYPFRESDTHCQKTSLNFVDSLLEIFESLLHGIRLVIIPEQALKDYHQLISLLAKNYITHIVLIPSLLQVILDMSVDPQDNLPNLKYWVSSGETLYKAILEQFIEKIPQSVLINLYGTSEVWDATWYESKKCEISSHIPIGRPISNTQIYLHDTYLHPVPVGVAGELCISGFGLARGYLNRPELTAEKFIPNPFSEEPGTRLYKTGDLARYLPDGNIEFIGRIDHQVKIRGFRIELKEIEMALSRHEDINECIVAVSDNEHYDKKLVAYIVCSESISSLSLRRFLRDTLPDYMIPSQFVQLGAIPLTPNGKVDYKLLQSLTAEHVIQGTTYIPPATKVEKQIAEIWQDVLGVKKVSLNDNFFDLGGHSLLLTKATSMIENKLNIQIPLREFFNQTLGQLAASCEEKKLKKESGYVDKST